MSDAVFLIDQVAPTGTIQRKVYDHLLSEIPGTEIGANQIANLVGQPSGAGIGKYLTRLVIDGLLAHRKHGKLSMWRLGGTSPVGSPQEPDDEVDDHPRVSRVSAAAVPSIFAYARQRAADPFAVFIGTDGRMKVERSGRLVAEFTDEERRQIVVVAAQGVVPR